MTRYKTPFRRARHSGTNRGWSLLAPLFLSVVLSATAQAALPKDASGWSILTPSPDTRLLYVSSVSGNDSTGAYYLPSDPLIGSDPTSPTGAIKPYLTYAAAWAQVRNGYADWVLCKRGETWSGTPTCGGKFGRSDTERIVITSYGSSTVRPLFKTGMGSATGNTNHGVENLAIVGLHFYCDGHDPASPTFAGYVPGPDGISIIVNGAVYFLENLLVEDCQVEWYGNNFDLQSTALGGAHDIAVRRNVINNSWMVTGHSQGLFGYHLSNFTLEENVFDHNGWYGFAGSGQGDATMFNHNTYLCAVHDVTFAGNMFLRASSIGTKWVNYNGEVSYNIALDNNLFMEGEIGMTLAGNDGGGKLFGLSNVTATNNVLEAIGRARPTGRTLSWGMDLMDIDGGTIQNNLIIRQDNPAVTNTYAIDVNDTSNRNLTIANNTIYRELSLAPLIQFSNRFHYSGNAFTNNIVDTNAYTSPVAQQTSSTFANYALDNNRYYSGAAAGSWFQIAGAYRNFTQWQAAAGEAGSTTGHTIFFDPTRTAETYNAALGGPGTFDDFIAQAVLQSKTNWRTAYTAAAVNGYIRTGLSVDRPPAFQTDLFTEPAATAGAAYSNSIAPNATDPDTSDTLTFSKQGGPAWLNVATSGALSGTPLLADAGLSTFTVRVTDGAGLSDDATLEIPVLVVPPTNDWTLY